MAFDKNKLMDEATRLITKGALDKAIKVYLKIVDEDPKDVRIWLKLGDLYAKRQEKALATETYLKVAEFYAEQGFYLKAVAVYKQILRLDTRLVEVNLRLAELYRQLGLLQDAMQQYEIVSQFYGREGRTRESLAALRQIVELDPENVSIRIKLAELYSKEGLAQEAIEEFSRAADFLRSQNRTDDLLKVLERLSQHKTDDLDLLKDLARQYLEMADPPRALVKLQTAFKADPRDEETLSLLAQAFQDLGQAQKAVSVLRELAHLLDQSGDTSGRNSAFERLLVLLPSDPEALVALGRRTTPSPVEMAPPAPRPEMGADTPQLDEEERLAHALTEADVYVKYGLHDKAVEHLRRVFDWSPDNIEARLKLKEIYLDMGRVADAVEELVLLGRTFLLSDTPRAATYLNEALDLDATHVEARTLLTELESPAQPFESPRVPAHRPPAVTTPAPVEDVQPYGQDEMAQLTPDELGLVVEPEGFDASGEPPGSEPPLEADPGMEVQHEAPPEIEVEEFDVSEAVDTEPPREIEVEEVEAVEVVADEELEPIDEVEEQEQRVDSEILESPTGEPLDLSPEEMDLFGRVPSRGDDPLQVEEPEPEPEPQPLPSEPVAPTDSAEMVEEFGVEEGAPSSFEVEVEAPSSFEVEVEVEAPSSFEVEAEAPPSFEVEADVPPAFEAEPEVPPMAEAEAEPHGAPEHSGYEAEAQAAPEAEEQGGYEAEAQAAPEAEEQGPPPSEAEAPSAEAAGAESAEAAEQDEIGDEIEEIDFFLQQSLYGEARDLLSEFMKRFGEHPALLERLAYIEQMEQRGLTPPPVAEPERLEFEVQEPTPLPVEEPAPPQYSVEEVVHEVKQSAEVWSPQEDPDAHFQLGAAYHEMSLLDDALREFGVAMKLGGRQSRYLLGIGRCLVDRKRLDQAAEHFLEALHTAGLAPNEAVVLNYELAAVYEKMGDVQQARHHYEKVAMHEPRFRDVRNRLERLREEPEKADADDFEKAFEDAFSVDDEGSGKR